MTALNAAALALADRALEAHQTAVRARLAYEEASIRVLRARDVYDTVLTEWEASRQAMRLADAAHERMLVELATLLKGVPTP